ncbi:hypothetical protein CUMW_213210 [Citrus unshiu]|uniref:AIG1-type G domain-containing protein n=1 Tax=Citrus unshiu TaxID=55188 RepID=A0A2H5QB35_CITUN|nr:hypothetical protein CUMW_213210 [Citrus unshiu]
MAKVRRPTVFSEEEPSSQGLARLVLLKLVKCREPSSKMAKLLMSLIPLDFLILRLALSLSARKLSNVLVWPRMGSMQSLLGKIFFDYMIVVFTGGDELEDNDETLEDYLGHKF